MSALKLFLKTFGSAAPAKNDSVPRDPLLHPDLELMSLTELADLPLMPENLGRSTAEPPAAKPALLHCA